MGIAVCSLLVYRKASTYPRPYKLEGCKQLGSYFTLFRLKEITKLAEQALALAARG
jgi:hypothetical protein